MCGIVAILRSMMPEAELRQAALSAGKKIQHRGPDWNGVRVFGERGIAIEHERLAIIDPESGAQPLVSNDPERSITCGVNGEIYNYKELAAGLKTPYKFLTKSDCEIIIPLYLEHGPDFVHLLRGMFSFVLYDHQEPDTGCWQRIHKAEFVGKPMSSFAVDFQVKGAKMQRTRRSAKLYNGKPSTRMATDVIPEGADADSGGSDVDAAVTGRVLEDRGGDDEDVEQEESDGQDEGDDEEQAQSCCVDNVGDGSKAQVTRETLADDIDPLL
ncbi:hypothetical protein AM588_10008162 [Phytophthora nicotianae]|uniref:Glutamine amidotransferase type-2 domain-containing protein n=1 Tax=Phytophthora nicotianae TaxID=4792 RepID=A0A0W8DE96_PHYNI|nr:hypothetical protein AM588_10008162 [Phytophthora nicotianae]